MKITQTRTGLRVRSLPGVHPEVRRACLEFASWIRGNMEFPIRVVVYLRKDYYIMTVLKEKVSEFNEVRQTSPPSLDPSAPVR